MPTRNINLTEHYDRFVGDQIKAGRFRNASEVLRAGLNLLEQNTLAEQHKLRLLKSLAAEGFRELDQGKGIEFGDASQVATFITGIGRRVAKASKRLSRES